jgi:hypothetical protein
MRHPNEEELIAYHDGDHMRRELIAEHVKDCPECRAELDRIDTMLAALDTLPVPDPGEDYGRQVWQKIAPRLPEKCARWWDFGLSRNVVAGWDKRRWAALGMVAALVIVAFVAGRLTRNRVSPTPETAIVADASIVRERVLLMAAGEHLGRSEMVLVELANAAPPARGAKRVNISAVQRRAEDLLEENRLYRQTALEEGDTGLASVLDELERVLLDVAHSPEQVTPAQLETIRQGIESRGILFKVRVVGKELQQREESVKSSPSANGATKSERNKA